MCSFYMYNWDLLSCLFPLLSSSSGVFACCINPIRWINTCSDRKIRVDGRCFPCFNSLLQRHWDPAKCEEHITSETASPLQRHCIGSLLDYEQGTHVSLCWGAWCSISFFASHRRVRLVNSLKWNFRMASLRVFFCNFSTAAITKNKGIEHKKMVFSCSTSAASPHIALLYQFGRTRYYEGIFVSTYFTFSEFSGAIRTQQAEKHSRGRETLHW